MDLTTQEWLGPDAVAKRVGLSAQRVRQLVDAGKLAPAIRTSLGRLVSPEAVERYRKEKMARRVGARRA